MMPTDAVVMFMMMMVVEDSSMSIPPSSFVQPLPPQLAGAALLPWPVRLVAGNTGLRKALLPLAPSSSNMADGTCLGCQALHGAELGRCELRVPALCSHRVRHGMCFTCLVN